LIKQKLLVPPPRPTTQPSFATRVPKKCKSDEFYEYHQQWGHAIKYCHINQQDLGPNWSKEYFFCKFKYRWSAKAIERSLAWEEQDYGNFQQSIFGFFQS